VFAHEVQDVERYDVLDRNAVFHSLRSLIVSPVRVSRLALHRSFSLLA
jgi:hypothetical protein